MNANRYQLLVISLSICIIFFSACKQPGVHYTTGTLRNIFAKAQRENKKVFILIGNAQCGYCDNFLKKLDSESVAREPLNKDFICYKINVHDSSQRRIAQIVKCPSYPFPYFFDKTGNLLAFGFPESRQYSVNNLENIHIDEYLFKELFRLPISTASYKQLVSLNLRSYLLTEDNNAGDTAILNQAYQMSKRSLSIAPYPFNLYQTYQLAGRVAPAERSAISRIEQPFFTHQDSLIYGDLISDIPFQKKTIAPAPEVSDQSYAFTTEQINSGIIKAGTDYPFHFEFTNTGKKALLIAKADHPCSCIELRWPKYPVKPGAKDSITGVYHASDKGSFNKNIYVHAVSPQIPMKIVKLTGVVD